MKFNLYSILLVLFFVTTHNSNILAQNMQDKDLLTLQAELKLRPESMSKNLVTTHFALGMLKGDYNNWLNNKGKYHSEIFLPKLGKGLLRTAKLGLVDWWISNHINMLNHELNGHAAYSLTMDKFHIEEMSLPFKHPMFRFNYLTKPSISVEYADAFVATKVKSGYSVTENDLAMLFAGGINASNTMRLNVEKDWLLSKRMHYHQSLLILQNHFDIFSYCLSTEYGTGTDVNNYLNFVNDLYLKFPDSLYATSNSQALISYSKEYYKFTPNQMKQVAYINTFGDPNLYYAFSNILYKYLIKGQPISNYKMLRIKSFEFMPSVGANLSPWGIQYFGQLNMALSEKKYIGKLYYGKNKYNASYKGFSLQALNLIETEKMRLDAQVDFFKQPQLILGKKLEAGETYTATKSSGGSGAMVSASLDYRLLNFKVPIYFSTTLGYKSAGFVPGQSIASTPIVALGISFDIMNFNKKFE